jgi:hypothetical protein
MHTHTHTHTHTSHAMLHHPHPLTLQSQSRFSVQQNTYNVEEVQARRAEEERRADSAFQAWKETKATELAKLRAKKAQAKQKELDRSTQFRTEKTLQFNEWVETKKLETKQKKKREKQEENYLEHVKIHHEQVSPIPLHPSLAAGEPVAAFHRACAHAHAYSHLHTQHPPCKSPYHSFSCSGRLQTTRSGSGWPRNKKRSGWRRGRRSSVEEYW